MSRSPNDKLKIREYIEEDKQMKKQILPLVISSFMLCLSISDAKSKETTTLTNSQKNDITDLRQQLNKTQEEKNYSQAFAIQQKIINIQPDVESYKELTSIYWKMDKKNRKRLEHKHAQAMLNANKAYPGEYGFMTSACWSYLKKSQIENAKKVCTDAYQFDLNSDANSINMAHVYYAIGNKTQFNNLLNSAISFTSSKEDVATLKQDFDILSKIYTPKVAKKYQNYVDSEWNNKWKDFYLLTTERLSLNEKNDYQGALEIIQKQKRIIKKNSSESSLIYADLLGSESYYYSKQNDKNNKFIALEKAYKIYKDNNLINSKTAIRFKKEIASLYRTEKLYKKAILFNDKFNYRIADSMINDNPELIDLILLTESMDDNERQDWFDIMPSMTNEQIKRLYNILDRERILTAAFDWKYSYLTINKDYFITNKDYFRTNKDNYFITNKDYYFLTDKDDYLSTQHEISRLQEKKASSNKINPLLLQNQKLLQKIYSEHKQKNIDFYKTTNFFLTEVLLNQVSLAKNYINQKKPAESIAQLKPYLEYANHYKGEDGSFKDNLLYAYVYSTYGNSLYLANKNKEARQYFDVATEALDNIKLLPYGPSGQNTTIPVSSYDVYLNYIHLLGQAYQPTDKTYAFALSEKIKARYLLNQLTKNNAIEYSGIPQSEKNEIKKYSFKIKKLFSDIATQINPFQEDLSEKLKSTFEEYEKLDKKLQKTYPRYKQLTEVKTVSKSQATASLPKNGLFLSYMYDEFNQSAIFALDKQGKLSLKTPKLEDIALLAESYRWFHSITSSQMRRKDSPLKLYQYKGQVHLTLAKNMPKNSKEGYSPEFIDLYGERTLKQLGHKLSKLLLSPFETEIANSKRLIIAPDGILATIPWDSLPYKDGMLSDHVDVTLTQSMSVYKLLKERESAYKQSDTRTKDLLLVGDAVYNKNKTPACNLKNTLPTRKQHILFVQNSNRAPKNYADSEKITNYAYQSMLNSKWDNLACASDEISYINSLMKGKMLTKKQASEKNVRAMSKANELDQYKRIHFAAHGFLNTAYPSLSSLVLTKTGASKDEDGYITASEWPELNLKSDLLVMSACETALGKIVKGEGIQGLPYALYVAGNRDTLLTLWKVSDAGTSVFMKRFWDYVHIGFSHSEALAKTKRDFSTGNMGKDYQDPYFWAGFVLYGV